MMILDILPKEPPQVAFMECDDMIEKLLAAAADPAFREPVLPRRLHAGALRRQPRGLEELNHIGIEFRIVVENDVPVRNRIGERLAELLHDPLGCRIRGHIAMEDAAPAVLDHEEAVQQAKGDARNGKEVEGDSGLPVIVEEGEPTFR